MRKSAIHVVLAAVVLICGTSSLLGWSQPCPPPLPPIVN